MTKKLIVYLIFIGVILVSCKAGSTGVVGQPGLGGGGDGGDVGGGGDGGDGGTDGGGDGGDGGTDGGGDGGDGGGTIKPDADGIYTLTFDDLKLIDLKIDMHKAGYDSGLVKKQWINVPNIDSVAKTQEQKIGKDILTENASVFSQYFAREIKRAVTDSIYQRKEGLENAFNPIVRVGIAPHESSKVKNVTFTVILTLKDEEHGGRKKYNLDRKTILDVLGSWDDPREYHYRIKINLRTGGVFLDDDVPEIPSINFSRSR